MKRMIFCLLALLAASSLSFADRLVDFTAADIEVANKVVRGNALAVALASCPAEVAAMAKAGAVVSGGISGGSYYGIQHDFFFTRGEKKASLVVRKTYRGSDGKQLEKPQTECRLIDTTDQDSGEE
jgi:hypothetical protein